MTTSTRGARTAAASALLVLALAVGGCSGDEPSSDRPEPAPSSATATPRPEVKTVVSYGRITGRLPAPKRHRLARNVRKVVDRWARAAYLGGEYPRQRFGNSWPGFTGGARLEAHRDRALMSNKDLGQRIDEVVPRRSRLRLDVLAVKHRPVGVTARVLLVFRTSGKVERVVRVQGRLYLTPTKHGWRVFGYDMTKERAR